MERPDSALIERWRVQGVSASIVGHFSGQSAFQTSHFIASLVWQVSGLSHGRRLILSATDPLPLFNSTRFED